MYYFVIVIDCLYPKSLDGICINNYFAYNNFDINFGKFCSCVIASMYKNKTVL